jgi:flavin-dependent dehydrogenase
MKDACDVLVIGGGPAGSITAGLLARDGVDVMLLERERVPRYHVGESLLPSSLAILSYLGVERQMDAYGFKRKFGAIWEWGSGRQVFDFSRNAGSTYPYAWDVPRALFDQMLFEHAASVGASTHDGIEVVDLEWAGGRPVAAEWRSSQGSPARSGRIGFRYLVDASGYEGFLAHRLRARRKQDVFQNVAVWGYWEDVDFPESPEGAFVAEALPPGWAWAISLHDGTTSIGIVAYRGALASRGGRRGLPAFYSSALDESHFVRRMIAPARMKPGIRAAPDHAYSTHRFAGPGFFLAGDAACFLDPLLSTGVHLAALGALFAAASVGSLLRGEADEEDAMAFYGVAYRRAFIRMMLMVSAAHKENRVADHSFLSGQVIGASDCTTEELLDVFPRAVDASELEGKPGAHRRALILERMTRLHDDVVRGRTRLDALDDRRRAEVEAKIALYDSMMASLPVRRDHAVGGTYIASKPYLRLAAA